MQAWAQRGQDNLKNMALAPKGPRLIFKLQAWPPGALENFNNITLDPKDPRILFKNTGMGPKGPRVI